MAFRLKRSVALLEKKRSPRVENPNPGEQEKKGGHLKDKTVKALIQKVSTIEKQVHQLVNAPTHNAPGPVSPQQGADNHSETTPGQSSSPYGGPRNTTDEAKARTNDSRHWWVKIWVWKPWKRVIVVLAGVLGIAYATINYNQWQDTRHNFETDQRAWVYPASADVPDSLAGLDKLVAIPMTLVNSGKSPAYAIHLNAALELVGRTDAPSFTFETPHSGSIVPILFPGKEHRLTNLSAFFYDVGSVNPRHLLMPEVVGLIGGDSYIALVALIQYMRINSEITGLPTAIGNPTLRSFPGKIQLCPLKCLKTSAEPALVLNGIGWEMVATRAVITIGQIRQNTKVP